MNVEDTDIAWAERDASPTRARTYDPDDRLEGEYERTHARDGASPEAVEEVEEVERTSTRHHNGPHGTPNETGSVSSSASSVSSVQQEEIRGQSARQRHMSTVSKTSTRMERDMMDYLDRHPTAVSRIEAHRLQHMQTVGSRKFVSREGVTLPDFGSGKPYPPPLPEREEYVVEFSGFDDPRHAQNFPMRKKVQVACVLIFFSLGATLCSSIFSAATGAVEQEFKVGQEVVTLGGTSLFVLGYALGPMIFAPISELYGRRVPILVATFGFAIFNTAIAVAKDYQTLAISRFFAGIFGSCPLAVTGAVFADMFDNKVGPGL